jgi:hypothetical protein
VAPNGSDTPTHQYSPDQSQYVPPLESWPPQAPTSHGYAATAYDYQAPAAPARPSVLLPWILVACGLIIPLVALIVALWAWTRSHSDSRYTAIMFGGFGVFALAIFLSVQSVGASPIPY